jgi:osmotically inducible protein OsmC
MPTRKGKAQWSGDLKGGNGTVEFGQFSGTYTFKSRFEEGDGTNPEELLGAAHAGCYSMALSNMLAQAGHVPTLVSTTAQVALDIGPDGAFISGIELQCVAEVPGIENDDFAEIAEKAKEGCPVSQALAATPISLFFELVS